MTRVSIEMDNLMPEMADDFDFGAFLNLPPDDVDQGVVDGPISLGPNCSGNSPAVWNEAGHASDSKSSLCDERHPNVPWPSHNQTLLDSSENAEASQNTSFQLQNNNAFPGSVYGASNFYGDEIGVSGGAQPASVTALKPNGSQTIAMGERGEVCTIPSDQDSSPPLTSGPASPEASESHCACISCLKIRSWSGRVPGTGSPGNKCRFPDCLTIETGRAEICRHETSHYEGPRGYQCLEQDCRTVTSFFDELRRHYKKHCTSPRKEIFSCPVLSCKYSGNNGFVRKDKLQSHYRNIHEGKPGPVKAGRVIKSATLKPRVSSVGNGSSKQKE